MFRSGSNFSSTLNPYQNKIAYQNIEKKPKKAKAAESPKKDKKKDKKRDNKAREKEKERESKKKKHKKHKSRNKS